jgi:hypothetical protein
VGYTKQAVQVEAGASTCLRVDMLARRVENQQQHTKQGCIVQLVRYYNVTEGKQEDCGCMIFKKSASRR